MPARPTAPRFLTALVLPVALALALAGCGSATVPGSTSTAPIAGTPTSRPTRPPAPTSPVTTGPVTITGVPERGVETSCLVLQGYTLNGGDRVLLMSGRTVKVTGHPDPRLASYCQQGTILVVESVVTTS